jgi:eukaryotic-like serine/threonine-protein kinase
MPAEIGKLLKRRYLTRILLGEGGMEAVYLADDILLEKPCVVNEFRLGDLLAREAARLHEEEAGSGEGEKEKPAVITHEKAVRQFMQAARLLLKLEHANLPKVTDYFEVGGNCYLVMVLVEGRDLAGLMEESGERPFSEQQVKEWLGQVMDAVGYCHAEGVIHGEIRPANVMVGDGGKVYLVGFGIVQALEASGEIAGEGAVASGYAPPEYGHQRIDNRSDIYAMGATMYALLTAREPRNAVERKQGGELPGPRQINGSISPGMDAVIQRAMSMQSADRFQSVEEMRTALGWEVGRSQPAREASAGGKDQVLQPAAAQGVKPADQKTALAAGPAPVAAPYPGKPNGAGQVDSLMRPRPAPSPRSKKPLIVIGIMVLACISIAGLTWFLQRKIAEHLHAQMTSTVFVIKTVQAAQTLTAAPPSTATYTLTYTSTPTVTLTSTITLSPTSSPTLTLTPTITTTPTFTPTPSITPMPQLGSTQVSPIDKMVMVFVPKGSFWMGSNYGAANNRPIHQVNLEDYWIDKTEITNSMYDQCVRAKKCAMPSRVVTTGRDLYFGNPQYDDFPVVYVSWDDAVDYCEWAGRRLPTEAEWEKAARGINQFIYPWGNFFHNDYANSGEKYFATMKVGSFPAASPYGALDMAGNVWEWVHDWYEQYSKISPDKYATGPTSGLGHVQKGGSWASNEYDISTFTRVNQSAGETSESVGFRCIQSQVP